MVDREIIQQKINTIETNVNKLKILAELTEKDFLNKFYYVEAAKYLLQISIEAMLDIAHHVIARERYRTPRSYAEAFLVLLENGILPFEKEKEFLQMAGFRNRVVHLYNEINEKEIYRILQERLEDFKEFIKAIVKKYI